MTERSAVQPGGRKRVLIFVDKLDATGVVRNAVALANHLGGRGYDVLLLSTAGGVLERDVSGEVTVEKLLDEKRGAASRRVRLASSFRAYRRTIRRFDPDVLISAGNHGHFVSALAAGASPRSRTIFRISNDLEHRLSGKTESRLARLVRRAQLRLILARGTRLVLVSRHLLSERSLAEAEAAGKVRVIPNGVDVEVVRQRASEPADHPWLSGSEPLVVSAGRFVPQKNFASLIRAVAIARKERPLRLILLGEGPLRENLLDEARELGIAEAVRLLDPVANPMPFFAKAAAVAVPSWWEGASNVLLEAIACGTPVVASRTAGNAEEVLDGGRYGLLVEPGDAAALARALLTQTGDRPVVPGDIAEDFDLKRALDRFAAMVDELAL